MESTIKEAMDAWTELTMLNGRADAAVNDLLEEIAGTKYLTSEKDDDPIYHTICNLTDTERSRFLAGCQKIKQEI